MLYYDIYITIALCGIFWKYGSEVGVDKRLSFGLFALFYAVAVYFEFWIVPLSAAIMASAIIIPISIMNDKKKKERVLAKQEEKKKTACPNCRTQLTSEQTRCHSCGRSLL